MAYMGINKVLFFDEQGNLCEVEGISAIGEHIVFDAGKLRFIDPKRTEFLEGVMGRLGYDVALKLRTWMVLFRRKAI